MKYLISLISFAAFGAYANDLVFIGKPIESHIYVRPLSVERLHELEVPSPQQVHLDIEQSNGCGLEISVFKIKELFVGGPEKEIKVHSFLGEWCQSNFQMGELKLFHLLPPEPFRHVLEYEYIHDKKHGLVIPGPGESGMTFMGVPFRDALKDLSEPVYAGSKHGFERWQEAIAKKEIIFEDDSAYYTTGVSVNEILSNKNSNK